MEQEQDNVKWKYNKAKHEVVEQPTMKYPHITYLESNNSKGWLKVNEDYDAHIATLRHIPVSGKVDWKDSDDVTGKFNELDTNKYFWCICHKCGWQDSSQNAAGGGSIADTGDYDDIMCPKCFNTNLETDDNEAYRGIVAIPIIKQEQPDTGAMKRAIISGTSLEYSSKIQSQEQDNVTGGELDWKKDLYIERDKQNKIWIDGTNPPLSRNERRDDTGAICAGCKAASIDYCVEYFEKILSPIQSRIQSLEASNYFHKQQAHEAINEQNRLQKALEQIEQMSDPGSYENAIINMKQIASKVLKP